MSIENGKDCRNWLNYPEEHMAIKEKRRMLKYQVSVFQRELNKEQRVYDDLLANFEKRKAAYKPKYESLEELNEAYIVSRMPDREYMAERSRIWQVYSDRGHPARIEWLTKERDKYKSALDALEKAMGELKSISKKKLHPGARRQKKAAQMRRLRRKWKRQALEERWKKYGLK